MATALTVLSYQAHAADHRLTDAYAYRDTQELVAQVEDAADLLEHVGLAALTDFSRKGSRWFPRDTQYIFVFSLDGTCLFSPGAPQLVGHQSLGVQDADGRRLVEHVVDIARKPDAHARGWTFFQFATADQIIPTWKAAYVRRATLPDGQVVAIGAGSFSLKPEQVFAKDAVEAAAELIEQYGPTEALPKIRNDRSGRRFAGLQLFVITEQGESLIDPAFTDAGKRNFREIRDASGNRPVAELLRKLRDTQTASIEYLQKNPATGALSRKYLLMRRARWQGQTFVIGSEYFLPVPIWMGI